MAEPQRTRREFLGLLRFSVLPRHWRPADCVPRANYFVPPLNLSLPLLPQIPARYPGIGPLRALQPTTTQHLLKSTAIFHIEAKNYYLRKFPRICIVRTMSTSLAIVQYPLKSSSWQNYFHRKSERTTSIDASSIPYLPQCTLMHSTEMCFQMVLSNTAERARDPPL